MNNWQTLEREIPFNTFIFFSHFFFLFAVVVLFIYLLLSFARKNGNETLQRRKVRKKNASKKKKADADEGKLCTHRRTWAIAQAKKKKKQMRGRDWRLLECVCRKGNLFHLLQLSFYSSFNQMVWLWPAATAGGNKHTFAIALRPDSTACLGITSRMKWMWRRCRNK